MRDDIRLKGWQIETESANWRDDFHESVFFTGNGRVGMRGHLPCGSLGRPTKAGLFVAGIFAQIRDGITDIVHLPTPVWEDAFAQGAPLAPRGPVWRQLNLENGVFSAHYTLAKGGASVQVRHYRFAHLHNPGCIVQRSVYRPSANMQLEIHSGVCLAARNSPVPDDQVKQNDEIIRLVREAPPEFAGQGLCVRLETLGTGLAVTEDCRFQAQGLSPLGGDATPGKAAWLRFAANAKAGREYVVDKLCYITTSRDKDARIAPPPAGWGFDELLRAHTAEWARRWQQAALPPLPLPQQETALRYTAAMLVMNGPASDDSVSIGARGLSHARYKGCYFWDTDFFLMPYYLRTHPQTARNLIKYRLHNLPAARLHAQKTSAKGARYPWMAALDGSEQCESWDIGLAEVHITADVVFGIDQYICHTGDSALYPLAAEVYIETARFWADRYTKSANGQTNLLFVKGPDEYCGITSNNLFTNLLVKHNLRLACKAAEYLRAHLPESCERLGLNEREAAEWAALEEAIPLPRNPETGHLQQDDSFHLLETAPPGGLKKSGGASYHHVSFDRLQRYKVIKQADLLLAMTRLPGAFTAEEKRLAWQEYEPVCLHDSTLSFASHALFAAQNGYAEEAKRYLEKALFLDLRDLMENTGGEGLHLACFGEAWQAAICLYAEKP